MKLIIIRHGDPDYEHDSLTQKGVREAQLLSDRISQLDVKAFYCSPLGRAQDRLPSVWTKYPEHYDYDNWYKSKIMRYGTVERKYKNVCEGIDELLKKHGYEHNGRVYKVNNSNHDTIVLFCHFGVECVLLSHIFSCSPMVLWHNFVALPTSVTTLITEERERGIASFRCQQFGDISHLYKGGEEPAFAARFCECFDDDTRH